MVLLNGKLEDAAVGIGTVARERRKGFLSSWQSAYALIPTGDGALRRAFPRTGSSIAAILMATASFRTLRPNRMLSRWPMPWMAKAVVSPAA